MFTAVGKAAGNSRAGCAAMQAQAAPDPVASSVPQLHANTIGADAFDAGLESLRSRGADAVEVQRDEAEHALACMSHDDLAPDRSIAREFVQFALEAGVLRFGEFKTKAGRLSPYFFNSGLFDDGIKLMRLGEFYARRLVASGLAFDMLFGPAYKGITLAAAVAVALGRDGRAVPFAYNRKEAKDHGEGGLVVGAPLRGRVVIVDDVITDGASKRESVQLLRREGSEPVAVLIALDRMERGGAGDNLSDRSAVEDFERDYAMPVIPVATVADLLDFLTSHADPTFASHADAVARYRRRYGI